MPTKHLKGPLVPLQGEDLLSAWGDFVNSAGIFLTVDSVSAARAVLSQLEAAGRAPTAANPTLFVVEANTYMSDGSKKNDRWVLKKLDETEVVETTGATGSKISLAYGKFTGLLTSSLGAKPYDRSVTVFATGYAQVTAGAINLSLRIGSDEVVSRFDAGVDDAASAFVINTGIIRAGVTPNIQLGFLGTDPKHGTSAAQTASDARLNRMVVEAKPISMN